MIGSVLAKNGSARISKICPSAREISDRAPFTERAGTTIAAGRFAYHRAPMRVLIVGAGAVGMVFGRHLALGGAEVTFFVKPRHADAVRAGQPMYLLNRGTELGWSRDYQLLTAIEEVAAARWDAVLLAVSSTALRAGPWLDEMIAATGDATIVFLQPNLDDRAYLLARADAARVVDGTIGFLSYHAPMPGEERRFAQPGLAYWFPPLAPSPFSGADARVRPLVDALRKGKLPAKRVRDLPASAPFPSALLYAIVTSLEGAGWSFATLRQGDRIAVAGRAARQLFAIVERELGHRAPLGVRLASRAPILRAVLRLQRLVVPLDLEQFFRVHFTKVGDQTRAGMTRYLELGRKASLPVDAVEQLVGYL